MRGRGGNRTVVEMVEELKLVEVVEAVEAVEVVEVVEAVGGRIITTLADMQTMTPHTRSQSQANTVQSTPDLRPAPAQSGR